VENSWQELAPHIKCGFHSEGNPQGVPSVLGTSRAAWLPCPRHEGNSGITANSRERQAPSSVVPSSHNRAGKSVLQAWPKTGFSGLEVSVVFVKKTRCAVHQGRADGVLRIGVSEPAAVAPCALTPFVRSIRSL
jgi:hypothetical protein